MATNTDMYDALAALAIAEGLERLGLSPEQAAARTGGRVSGSTIRRIIALQTRRPRACVKKALAELLDQSVIELWQSPGRKVRLRQCA